MDLQDPAKRWTTLPKVGQLFSTNKLEKSVPCRYTELMVGGPSS